jgi:hypothetical protein
MNLTETERVRLIGEALLALATHQDGKAKQLAEQILATVESQDKA